eukprot:TRINITY_DN1358_c0_g1_i1.p1 TRINITY_DN1358_c0_g1~~TRINITY_DN1358_c0_g1_i1.p1  ORF type:complete len:388 (-),score=55.19 TRINITY_DN1358_c0_g1_i1:58-1221(-)
MVTKPFLFIIFNCAIRVAQTPDLITAKVIEAARRDNWVNAFSEIVALQIPSATADPPLYQRQISSLQDRVNQTNSLDISNLQWVGLFESVISHLSSNPAHAIPMTQILAQMKDNLQFPESAAQHYFLKECPRLTTKQDFEKSFSLGAKALRRIIAVEQTRASQTQNSPRFDACSIFSKYHIYTMSYAPCSATQGGTTCMVRQKYHKNDHEDRNGVKWQGRFSPHSFTETCFQHEAFLSKVQHCASKLGNIVPVLLICGMTGFSAPPDVKFNDPKKFQELLQVFNFPLHMARTGAAAAGAAAGAAVAAFAAVPVAVATLGIGIPISLFIESGGAALGAAIAVPFAVHKLRIPGLSTLVAFNILACPEIKAIAVTETGKKDTLLLYYTS